MQGVVGGCVSVSFPRALETAELQVSDTSEHVVASQSGAHSCCDVWFVVEEPWLPRVTLRLYAFVGGARVLVGQSHLAKVPTTSGEGGRHSGIAISIRGRPCNTFELTVQASAGPELEGGVFYLQAWHEPTRPHLSTDAGPPAITTGTSLVAATLIAREDSSGELREVVVDDDGRLVIANPLFTDEAEALLDGATAAATPNTLALRDGAAGCGFATIHLVDASPAGAPPSGTAWLSSAGGKLVAHEPNGIVDAFTYADAASGAGTKLHRKYVGRVTTTTSTVAIAATIPAADLPTANWSAHLTARIHAYDVQNDEVHKLTREAGARRTSGTVVVPTQDQVVGTDLTEGGELNGGITAASGDLVVYVQHFSSTDVRWTAWVELHLVAH